jgi:hypothetical protein
MMQSTEDRPDDTRSPRRDPGVRSARQDRRDGRPPRQPVHFGDHDREQEDRALEGLYGLACCVDGAAPRSSITAQLVSRGRSTQNVVPAADEDSTLIEPPCAMTIGEALPATPATSRQPGPVPAETGAVPVDHRSGFTKTSTSIQRDQKRRSAIQNHRSAAVMPGWRPLAASTASCCRSARFSSTRSERRRTSARAASSNSRTRRVMGPPSLAVAASKGQRPRQIAGGDPNKTNVTARESSNRGACAKVRGSLRLFLGSMEAVD